MKILHAYVLRSFLINFLIGILVFLSVLLLGSMIKEVAEKILQGYPLKTIGLLFLLFIPYLLTACIPMSFLTSLLLVFGRLSQDNEIVAMKASGISVRQVAYPLWLLGILLSFICFKINNDTVPYTHFAARKLIIEMGLKNPTACLEPGNFVEVFPNHIIYIRERHNDLLKNIVIYQTLTPGSTKTITAKEGKMVFNEKLKEIDLELKDGTIQEPSGKDSKNFYNLQFGTYTLKLDTAQLFQDPNNIDKKHKDMTIAELRKKIEDFQPQGINTTPFLTEIHKKIALSFACFTFSLIGIPLGIRAHRSEKTVGVALSLLLVFLYYLFIIFGKALDEKTQLHPELLMWVPNFLLTFIGIHLFRKVSR